MLKEANSSTKGYTDVVEMNIEEDEDTFVYNLVAWGKATQGEIYQHGNYTIEIWHVGCERENFEPAYIASKTFTLK